MMSQLLASKNAVLKHSQILPIPDILIRAHISTAIQVILQENANVLDHVDTVKVYELIQQISQANRLFLVGEGRSGLVAKMAAMRLMHLGLQTYVVGETITPSIQADDLLIACTGSGTTSSVCLMASQAQAVGAQLAVVTARANSPLGEQANIRPVVKLRDNS